MAETLHDVLERRYVPHQKLTLRSNLSLKEQQTIYRLDFGRKRLCSSFRVDGNIISEWSKCDFLILARRGESDDAKWMAVFVELKGTDVEYALEQIKATLAASVFRHDSVGERHARIVAKSFPANKANPKFEKAKRDLCRQYHCTLRQVSSGNPDMID